VLLDRPELNEKITAITTGAIDHVRYAHVVACRKRGFLHGLLIHPRTNRRFVEERSMVVVLM
jgi:hypothetical protein